METHSSILAWRIPLTDSLAGYSPWGCKDSDITERLNNNKKKKEFTLKTFFSFVGKICFTE